ncbi:tyrosine-type recombinase/integrase [Microtetraspora sp. AC03309]|uniref:tyrosine-type recombinase/integrase n=1 Tax=Microtetraspora sp. AC03309 TaxID=2779376 RepID=UPI001E3DD28B|nr:tyrosine-type recombinase/integrase [Microtetraspora sp. AC03309]MCC5576268.1 tyrosine-type recombinase/integrase [Microtetraspora sp. AC03309]
MIDLAGPGVLGRKYPLTSTRERVPGRIGRTVGCDRRSRHRRVLKPLDRWHVRREFQQITKAVGLGEDWSPRGLRHSFVSILSAHDVPVEDISDLVGHVSTHVTETVYRHEIRPALTKGAQAMVRIPKKRAEFAVTCRPPVSLPKIRKGVSDDLRNSCSRSTNEPPVSLPFAVGVYARVAAMATGPPARPRGRS